MAIDQHAVINLKLRSKTARICANCTHWHPDMWEKWGWCDVALNKGTFHNHRTGCRTCKHSNNRYRSQKGCKNRFEWKGSANDGTLVESV